jgi:ABC transport system ATP-binding/permease protein
VANRQRTEADAARLEELKDTLALLSGMEGANVREIERKLEKVDDVIRGQPLDTGGLKSRPNGVVSAERLFTNQKVSDLVAKAETEQNDYRLQHAVNPFFSPEKHYDFKLFGKQRTFKISVHTYAATVLIGSSMILLGLLHFVLRRQLRTKGT